MCVLAHPDDECLGTGGILARYAAEGAETYLITATRGEHGWWGEEKDYPVVPTSAVGNSLGFDRSGLP
jgi:LmbE family N-acetylglucosaminyl deacetylase